MQKISILLYLLSFLCEKIGNQQVANNKKNFPF
jgi:hypothetical protein